MELWISHRGCLMYPAKPPPRRMKGVWSSILYLHHFGIVSRGNNHASCSDTSPPLESLAHLRVYSITLLG
jgi:hypothetical protein